MYEPLLVRSGLEKTPLRVGLLLDSTDRLLHVFGAVVDHIRRSNFARLELLVVHRQASETPVAEPQAATNPVARVGRILRDPKRRSALLYNLYCRWDQRNTPPPEQDPTCLIDCSSLFEGVPVLPVTPITKRFVHRFPAEAITAIRQYDLDVLLRFGFNILRGDILQAARHGVWSFHHGDNDYYRGGPAHFWEMVEGHPLSSVILQVLTEQLDAGRVLAKGHFATHPGFSLHTNRLQPYWGSSTFVIQKLRELYEHGPEELERRSVPNAPYQGRKAIYTTPNNREMVRWLGPLLVTKSLRRLGRKPTVDHWRLAIRCGGPVLHQPGRVPEPAGFHAIESPRGRFYADPFVVRHGGKPWVFFEDYDYRTEVGRISAAPVEGEQLGTVQPVLEEPFHLSYPCLFEVDGEWFMIPESIAGGGARLYRCKRFPGEWELVRQLFGGPVVDTTVCRRQERFWFFTSMKEPRGNGIQLWLFHSGAIDGEWIPHPQNPLRTDIRDSRCAGAIFEQDGNWYRPSQDCSVHYGRSFRFNEITHLDTQRFAEKPGPSVEPVFAPGLVGTHTYAHAGNLEVIDTCARMPTRLVW